ncbi:hypothetical protein BD311DRAFT_751753 [Dichomitus squalens]|uniref:Uncharacterized protein n=1 Tax=Dichomitus squalens TaxID=114155 RepID=A0A4Q9MZ39_9APHY|nr:hypothetical protein BD311DRAFT_751753 [Dichomitus squalens]
MMDLGILLVYNCCSLLPSPCRSVRSSLRTTRLLVSVFLLSPGITHVATVVTRHLCISIFTLLFLFSSTQEPGKVYVRPRCLFAIRVYSTPLRPLYKYVDF